MPNWFRRKVLARAALLGLSQQQIARLASMDEAYLSKTLRGRQPAGGALEKIGRVLDLSVKELIEDGHHEALVRPHPAILRPDSEDSDWEGQIWVWMARTDQ